MGRILLLIIISISLTVDGQDKSKSYYTAPLGIPMFLTGNFGELRSNHFHSGIDIKTEGRTGLPVFAAADGYVSRIYVSPYGFGNALYIDHPNGTTTVYGHLEIFSENIEKYIRTIQYKKQSFNVDISVPKDKIPVHKGEQIALSGNSGSSGGPHLHFEIRNSKTQHPLNPLKYNFEIKDDIKPKILSVLLYPVSRDASIAGSQYKKRYETVYYSHAYHISKNPTIPVYGTIGFGLQALDYLTGNWSRCGIYSIQLKVDNNVIYSFKMDEFSFDESRYINSHIDYEQKVRYGRNIYKTWIEPGNKLSIYNRKNGDGTYSFTDGNTHKITYEITDVYGNHSKLTFNVISKKQNIQKREEEGILFHYDEENHITKNSIELIAPKGAFYDDFFFDFQYDSSFSGIYSKVYKMHNKYTPIHKYISIKIKPDNLPEELQDKALLAFVNPKTKRLSAIGGNYNDGWVEGRIRSFGEFAVTIDTIAPTITPLSFYKGKLKETSRLRFRIKDDFSGINKYRGTIDGNWVLFQYDAKNSIIFYEFDKERFIFNKQHELELIVEDSKGNLSTFKTSFFK